MLNKNTIIALLLITAGIVVFITASRDVSTYSTFADAAGGERTKIVGTLAKNKPMTYDPENDPNTFRFFMTDSKGTEKEVILQKPKPQDFELSEQIVVTGKMQNESFVADEILMKCPSKYKDEEIAIKEQQ
ncbi:MAG: cytochrome c maturation protein CcmE [Saprospiraceae bacterium]|nr:cytochrome c maturation protein CcmE [Saprospiraceae bacterium]